MDNNNQPNPYATPASDVATPPSLDTAKCPGFVKAGITLIMAISVMALIGSFFTFDMVVAAMRAQHNPLLNSPSATSMLRMTTTIGGVVSIALYALFCWFVSKRKNWARIVLLVFSILSLMSGLPGLMRVVNVSLGLGLWVGSLSVIMLCGALCLFMPVSNAWFRRT